MKQRGYGTVTVKVIDGSHDDALLAAVKLNARNGLRFKDGDWEKIVPLIASKGQWKDWTNRRLAEELVCSEYTVRKYRPEESVASEIATEKRQGKDGKMYKAKKAAKTKTEQSPDTASLSSLAKKPAHAENTPQTEGRPADVKECEAAPFDAHPETTGKIGFDETRSTDRHRIEANVKETQILATISQLQVQIAEWFEIAPDDMREGFDKRLRKRIGELID